MVGVPLALATIENDLEERVLVVAASHPEIVDIAFSGQTGTIVCTEPLDAPALVVEELALMSGVRSVVADRSCRVSRAPTVDPTLAADIATTTSPSGTTARPGAGTVPTTTQAPAPLDAAEVLEADPALSVLHGLMERAGLLAELSGDLVLLAPTDAAFDALGADVLAAASGDPDLLTAVLRHHMIGPDDRERLAVDADDLLVDGRARVIDRVEVGGTDIWTIDRVLLPDTVSFTPILQLVMGATGITLTGVLTDTAQLDAVLGSLAGADASTTGLALAVGDEPRLDPTVTGAVTRLITGIVGVLHSATLTIDDDGVTLVGTYDDPADGEAITALANVLEAEVSLDPRPPIDDDEAARITEQILTLVSERPIAFNSGGTRLTEASREVIDQIAVILARVPEAPVLVRGHTDSDGVPESNGTLSAARADAVIVALIERGIDPGRLAADGVGAAEPILVDGVEDKIASRRVEFVVSAP